MAEDNEAEVSPTKKWLAVGAVLIALVAIYIYARSPAKTDGTGTGTNGTSESSSSGGSSGNAGASSSSSSGASSGNPTTTASSSSSSSGSSSGSGSGGEDGGPGAITSGNPVDVTQLLLEAKTVEAARTALAAGDPRKALKELEFYDKIPNAQSLRQEATLLKIEALQQVGRKTDARALAMSTRDDPSFNTYQGRINDLLFPQDSGK